MPDKTRLTPTRRTEYADAAIRAFARGGGYHGTTLNDIAIQAGVTQPRISQVYGNKLDAFLEAHQRAADTILEHLQAAVEVPFDADKVARRYLELLDGHRDMLLVVQFAVSAAVVPEIGRAARAMMARVWSLLIEAGATPTEAKDFVSMGMLLQSLVAIRAQHFVDEEPALGELLQALLPGQVAEFAG